MTAMTADDELNADAKSGLKPLRVIAYSTLALSALALSAAVFTDRAEAGQIAVSFRTDETYSDSLRSLAGNIERYSSGGPLECTSVDPHCVALYGPCRQHYRCGIRLPE